MSNFNQKAGIIEGDRDAATEQFIRVLSANLKVITTKDFKKIKPPVSFQHIRHFKLQVKFSGIEL